MLRKSLNRAIKLFDNTPGVNLLDTYFSSLYKEEITELKSFLSFVFADIRKTYKANNNTKGYVDKVNKEYIGQLSETNQVVFIFNMDDEADETITDEFSTDIVMKFRSYHKSVWSDQFKISGNGYLGGISLKELDDWELLINFVIDKKFDSAKLAPTTLDETKEVLKSLDDIKINMIDID